MTTKMNGINNELLRLKIIFNALLKMVFVLWKHERIFLFLTVLFQVALGLIPLVQIYLTTSLINLLVSSVSDHVVNPDLFFVLILQILSLITSVGLTYLNNYMSFRMNQNINFYFDNKINQKVETISYEMYEKSEFLDLMHRVSNNIGQRSINVFNKGVSIQRTMITLIGYMMILFKVHWSLILIMILITIPLFIVNFKFGDLRLFQMIQLTPINRRLSYLIGLLRGKESAKELRSFDIGEYISTKWKDLYWNNSIQQRILEKNITKKKFMLEIFILLSNGLSMVVLILYCIQGKISIGNYVALTQTFQSTQSLMRVLSDNISNIYEDALFIEDYYRFMNTNQATSESSKEQTIISSTIPLLKVNQLGYKYPSNNRNTLSNISFEINIGEKVAIVGENGSGKSSLIKCLLGLYTVSEGRVMLNGVDIENIDRKHLSHMITVVYQDFIRYQLTIRENIAIGQISKIENHDEITLAAQKSGVSSIVKNSSKGLNTELGPMFMGGNELSLGQWQKIAISRAFLSDAKLAILDEPTASLDPVSEVEIFSNFLSMCKQENKTALIISHRLGICKHVDKILVLKEGELVETGSHNELIEKRGHYYNLHEAQSKWST